MTRDQRQILLDSLEDCYMIVNKCIQDNLLTGFINCKEVKLELDEAFEVMKQLGD